MPPARQVRPNLGVPHLECDFRGHKIVIIEDVCARALLLAQPPCYLEEIALRCYVQGCVSHRVP